TDEEFQHVALGGKLSIITHEGLIDMPGESSSNIKIVIVDGKAVLYYIDDYDLLMSTDFNTVTLAISSQSASIDGFEMSVNEYGSVIFYNKLVAADYSQIFCAIYDEKTQSWIDDIALTDGFEGIAYNPSGFIDSNGDVVFSYVLSDPNDKTVLCFSKRTLSNDISITDWFVMEKIENGKEVEVFFEVANTGDKPIACVEIELFGQKSYVYLETPILTGESRYISILTTAHLSLTKHAIVSASVIEDDNVVATTIITIETLTADIGLSGSVQIVNGKQNFTIQVSNDSEYTTSAKLKAYVNAELVEIRDLVLDPNSDGIEIFAFQEIFEGDYIAFVIETDIADWNYSDNGYSMVSLQTEITAKEIQNIYQNLVNTAKKFS
ncbi:MAG: hypothetical protein LBE09_09140, partial [Christensenellaceae bacterium]|nr:hypothetical protein [Christensenellaceae bacterium]